MSRVLVDCRLIDCTHEPALHQLAAVRREVAPADLHFLVEADRLWSDPECLGRLGLGEVPAHHVHRLHAPATGRNGSGFAAWRGRVGAVIAAAVAVELDARRILVPANSVEDVRGLWPAETLPSGVEVVALLWEEVGNGGAIVASGQVEAASAEDAPPRLALVTPLPPDQSGIADYALELIPELARHYRLELITTHPDTVTTTLASYPIRGIDWFVQNASSYDRIVYQVGNSHFHEHMFALNERHPGVVVLHDAFLSGVVRHMEQTRYRRGFFSERLYRDHGYGAVAERRRQRGERNTVMRYPCSLGVIGPALGVVVHSREARSIVASNYGENVAAGLSIIPHLRALDDKRDRISARRDLGLGDDTFLVCSFGATSLTKMNDRLLSAWRLSAMGGDPGARLVFVGGGGDGYAQQLVRSVAGSSAVVTGRCSAETYRRYLHAADLAVQLRCLSRGETSGAALDCMAAGLPLIVNRHGSMAELPETSVAMIDEDFSDAVLAAELDRLRSDATERARLTRAGLDHVVEAHHPAHAGELYRDAIEAAYRQVRARWSLPRRLAAALPRAVVPTMTETAAACADVSVPKLRAKARLFFDVTAISRNDLRSGVERTVRNLLSSLIENPPVGFRIEPVRLVKGQLILARDYTCRLLGIRRLPLQDEPVAVRSGDIYLMADLAHRAVVGHRELYRSMRRQGVKVGFMVHDLLPVRLPSYFPPVAEADHASWLEVVGEADIAIGVTRHVAHDLADWFRMNEVRTPPAIGFSHHGSELQADRDPETPSAWERFKLRGLGQRPSFLVVGTVEPRKGHDDLLAAFDRLWAQGRQADLIVVGRAGFRPLDVIGHMRRHAEKGRRLFWLQNASDRLLQHLYRSSDCLIAPSRAEGFGLPLIEAGLHGLPVLARDIPVFREVAPDGTRFFPDEGPDALATAVATWLEDRPSRTPTGDVLTWAQSAANLAGLLTGRRASGQGVGSDHAGMIQS